MKSIKLMIISSVLAVSSFAVMGGEQPSSPVVSMTSVKTAYGEASNKALAIKSTFSKVQCLRGEKINLITLNSGNITCSAVKIKDMDSDLVQCTVIYSCN